MKELHRLYPKLLFWSLVLLLLAPWAGAQTPGGDAQPAQSVAPQEKKISPKEAEELFHDVDKILSFASKESELPIKHEVKRRLVSRDEVVAYLEKNMAEDKDAQRLRRSELVLKKFGLLPQEFDLQAFLLALLREQVAGYYDSKTKTVNLLDWLDAEQQRPVLAHELTHALQDQSYDLEKWLKPDTDINDRKEPTAADIEEDEVTEARQAVIEGQAMVTLVDYMLEPTGQSLLGSPQIAKALEEGMLVGTADSVEFKNAPLFLKEAMTFPYRYGLDFEGELLRSGGKQKAFVETLNHPPRNTRQIMEPKTYLSGERLEPLPLPDLDRDFKNYERFDIGAMGEFDVALLVDQYAGVAASHDLYPHWRGGYYYAARPKGDPTAPLDVLYLSRWSDADSAAKFAGIYANALDKRYKHVHQVEQNASTDVTQLPLHDTLTGTHTWLTEDGPVVIVVQAANVLVTESFDQAMTERLEQELLGIAVSAK